MNSQPVDFSGSGTIRKHPPHQGGQLIPTHLHAPTISYDWKGEPSVDEMRSKTLNGLSGSASLKGRILTLTVVILYYFFR